MDKQTQELSLTEIRTRALGAMVTRYTDAELAAELRTARNPDYVRMLRVEEQRREQRN